MALRSERDKSIANERKAVQSMMDFKKQFEAQELVSPEKKLKGY